MKEKKGEGVGQDKVRGRREKEEWVGGETFLMSASAASPS